ncbi:MAG: hypothetical protein MAG431_02439 [Chloroflexi bacterium]|nr:hypothetical protein [Chloroflexota bacterium]
MEMIVDFPGGARVDAHFGDFTVKTDQSPRGGGEGAEPEPFALFLSSLATCAGIYVLNFCKHRGLPTEDLRVVQRSIYDHQKRMVGKIELEIQVPPEFPQKYYSALVRSAEQCAVKKHIENPPAFEIMTEVMSDE